MTLKVLSANRLCDGHPVWYGTDGNWNPDINRAAVADNPQACQLLEEAARQGMQSNEIIAAELIDVEKREGALRALRLRERIRIDGPTIIYKPHQPD